MSNNYQNNKNFKKLKIIHLLPELIEGGVERHVISLANLQRQAGHEPIVVSAGGPLVEKLLCIRHFNINILNKNPKIIVKSAIELSNLCKIEKPHVMHAHSRVPAWAAYIASHLCGVPWVVTAHAIYSDNFGLYPYKKANGAICVSDAVRMAHAKRLPKNTQVIWAGLEDIKNIDNENKKINENNEDKKISFLFIGRLTRVKAPDVLLKAFIPIAKENKDAAHLTIVGDGPLKDALQGIIDENKIQDCVTLAGRQDDVSGYLRRADCAVFPSLEEGMGLAAAQTVAMKRPALFSAIPAFKEFFACKNCEKCEEVEKKEKKVDEKERKIFIKPNDIDAWTQGLRDFIKKPCCAACFTRDMSCEFWLQRTMGFYAGL